MFPHRTIRFSFLCAAALFFSVGICAPQASAQTDEIAAIDLKKGSVWPQLAEHIGTYHYEEVLTDPAIKKELDAMLKGQKVDLKEELSVRAPIGFEDDCLILKGNPDREAETRRAYLQVCINKGEINLALYNSGKVTVFTKATNYDFLTNGIRTWIYFQDKIPDITTKPDYVQVIVQPD